MNLPEAFENRMKRLLGDAYADFHDALCHEDPVKGLRVNTRKVSAEVFAANAPFDLAPIPYVDGGFIVADDAGAGKHPYHHAGAYYMQDPGAMATVAAIPSEFWEREDLKILDLCAAPGGKTTQLAALCAPRGGVVVASEYVSARSRILAGNAERMGLDNVLVTNVDSKYIGGWYPDCFDLVVVDAPCSGEGMYRKNDLAISEWSPENVTMCAARQREILDNAVKTVASGGYLLYSTCTYSTEENEEIVVYLLEKYPFLHLVPCAPDVATHTADGVDVTGGELPELAFCRRFYPHLCRGEGQFVALLQRDEGDAFGALVKDARAPLGKADAAVAADFFKETLGIRPTGLFTCGSNVVRFDSDLPIPPFGVVTAGVAVGEVRKGRITPHHHFFMAYGCDCSVKVVLDADDPAVSKYLAGEEIAVDSSESGYAAVLLRVGDAEIPLGGGKLSGGRLKNYYPKGLRVR